MNISEFARRVNLSTGTVSRALNNRAEVSSATRTMVLEKARELGFSPNATARRLVTGKNRLIRLECPDNADLLSDFYLVELARSVESAAHTSGYDLLLRLGSNRRDTTEFQVVDGLILLYPPMMSYDQVRLITRRGATSVAVISEPGAQHLAGASYVYIDSLPGVREAISLLAELGHRRIGYVNSGQPGRYVSDALPQIMQDARLAWDNDLAIDAGVTVEDGCKAALHLLAKPDRPSALFARTDVLAAGAMKAATQLGLSVPRDLSVIGHDNISAATLVSPSLTTVAIDTPVAGAAATRALLSMIDGSAPPMSVTLHSHLITRDSTAPPAC